MRSHKGKTNISLLTQQYFFHLPFWDLPVKFLLSDCCLLGLTWIDLQILKSEIDRAEW
jgi:hypothetical protein